MVATEQFLPMLANGDGAGTASLFAGQPDVADPTAGRVVDDYGYRALADRWAGWLADTGAAVSTVRTTVAAGRAVTEQVITWDATELPVALVGDTADDGRLTALRIYHSTWPLTGGHAVRPALLVGNADAVLSDVVDDYHRALASKALDDILATFEPDGYVREPAGGEHVHRGVDGRAAFYDRLLEFGEIILEHCTVTDDGVAAALEYNVVRWGPRELTPPQAGVAVYERGPSGKLAAARIYDDVDI